jgi:hypothetical protein
MQWRLNGIGQSLGAHEQDRSRNRRLVLPIDYAFLWFRFGVSVCVTDRPADVHQCRLRVTLRQAAFYSTLF